MTRSSTVLRLPAWRRLGRGALLVLAAASIGCEQDPACDQGLLIQLAAASPGPVDTFPKAFAERQRTSSGIRAACPGMPAWMTERMRRLYEGHMTTADERADWLASDASEAERKASAPLRERVCPNYDDVTKRMLEVETRGLKSAAAPVQNRGEFLWDGCDLARFGVHSRWPTAPGQTGPTGIFDFSVFLYLQDSGVDKDTALAVTRGLGFVSEEPPPAQ